KRIRQLVRADRRETKIAGGSPGKGADTIDLVDGEAGVSQSFLDRVQRQQHRMASQLLADLRLADTGDIGFSAHLRRPFRTGADKLRLPAGRSPSPCRRYPPPPRGS